MAPIKFEEDIKEKLENRRLQPSEEAWNNLEGLLDIKKKKNFKGLLWVGLVASLISIFFVIQQLRISNVVDNESKTILVDEAQIKENKKTNTPKVATTKKVESIIKKQELEIADTPLIEIKKEEPSIEKRSKNNLKSSKENANNLIALSIKNKAEIKKKTPKEIVNSNLLNEVVYEGLKEEISSEKIIVNTSEDEIDALLNTAKNNIQKDTYSIGEVVDPNSLLEDVETEMEPSLRRQIFKTIEKNYQSIKNSVVTRND